MEADADEAAAEPNSKHVKVSGQEFDLGALLGMTNLQEMLRTLAGTLVTTQHDNEQLRKELAAVKAAGEQREEKLEAMITAKANGVRVEAIALAFETFREEQRKAREGSDTMAGRIVTEQKEIRSQMDHFDDDILEIRRGLTKKIEAVVFEDLLARSAHFASKNALTECEARLSVVIEQVDDGSKERGRRQEAVSQDHTERLRNLERELPTLQPVQAAARERSALEESIRMAAAAEKERRACWPPRGIPPLARRNPSALPLVKPAGARCACTLDGTSARSGLPLTRTRTPPATPCSGIKSLLRGWTNSCPRRTRRPQRSTEQKASIGSTSRSARLGAAHAPLRPARVPKWFPASPALHPPLVCATNRLEDEVKTKADDAMVWADFAAVKKQIDVYNKGAEAELAEVQPLCNADTWRLRPPIRCNRRRAERGSLRTRQDGQPTHLGRFSRERAPPRLRC